MKLVWATIGRDVRLALHKRGDWVNPLVFFVMVVALFPVAMTPTPEVLAQIASSVVWVAALLAALLSLDGVFRDDVRDGSVHHWQASGAPLIGIALGKSWVHWCTSGLPLTLLSPVLGVMLSLSGSANLALFLSLLIGTPILSLLGTTGAALVASTRSGGVLLSVLILPLCIPVLIFAAAVVQHAQLEQPYDAPLALLGGLLCMALCITPLTTAAALTLNLEH